MEREYKTIKQIIDELNYLKEEHKAQFKLILSKAIRGFDHLGDPEYHYELFNEYKLGDPNDLEKKINQILSNKNLIAILEKDSMLLEIYYTTSARKNRLRSEYVYTDLGYTDIFLFDDEDKPTAEEFCIYYQSCWEIKVDNDCNCCYPE
jgi:hypothetical protein